MNNTASFFHVTSRAAAEEILKAGFLGGWGDDGFGVYVFDSLGPAEEYLADGGWDGSLQDAVIIEIEAPEDELREIDIDPHWPNPEAYEAARRYPMKDEVAESRWLPEMRILDADTAPELV